MGLCFSAPSIVTSSLSAPFILMYMAYIAPLGILILMLNFPCWSHLVIHMSLASPTNSHPWSFLLVNMNKLYPAFGMWTMSLMVTSFTSWQFLLQIVPLRLPTILPSIPCPDASMMLSLVVVYLIFLKPYYELVASHVAPVSPINTLVSSIFF